jgi:dTDP-4-dehydrorhamnose 3,5-epimerase
MRLIKSPIPGCYEIHPVIFNDERGSFVKTFHADFFSSHGLVSHFVEEYYSHSLQGVLRGLHFQLPPREHEKVVYCVSGEVFDVVVDLRRGSPSYGMFETFILNADKANMVYIPAGLAHGFYALTRATMMYKVSSLYSPAHDTGILWNSLTIPWPDRNPIISKRDSRFPAFRDFDNPFRYKTEHP